ncbi:unnamed protein product [Medioppia subpectinata]|uniref:non-specific serine/threonine protein kinase n=1 Tax=Medioppia subpectinata TaxID=1979941 RepID=A0A7R9KDD0_9ACAR|nr:unnamed protein product [Medioppia subpectinata]CAG2100183.1 unnamed protein product [Medioppia subpectinata]
MFFCDFVSPVVRQHIESPKRVKTMFRKLCAEMATNVETNERQMDELSALKAIFGSDLIDLRQSVANGGDFGDKWSPIEIQITLKPMVSMSQLNVEVYVQTDLYVKCGKKYPNVIPEDISLKNVKGLATSVCHHIRDELYQLAKSLRGEVMIFAFADHVRQSLHLHNKPPIQSFYDQMISHQTKREIQKNAEIERQLETNRQRDEMKRKQLEEEMRRKQKALLEESRFRRESHEDIGETLLDMRSEMRCDVNHELVCITFDVNGFERTIQRGKCLLHNHFKHSVEYLATDLSNGQTFVITEWILRLNDDNSVDDIMDRISKVETFFKTKLMSLNDRNLIHYLSMQYSVKSDYIVVDLLQEHINANSLFSLSNVMRGHPFNTSLITFYSKQILEIVNYLHRNNSPHGDLRPTNVFVDSITGDIKISENARWSAERLLYHSFLSSQKSAQNYSKYDSESDILKGRSEQTDANNYETNVENKAILNSLVSSSMYSRLNEFEVLDELGKGGFGYVYKVKNILDGRCYALKKIQINHSNHSLYEKIKREVNLLSRLNHENVVRYFTSWIESEDNLDFDSSEQSSTTKTSENITQKSLKVDTKSMQKIKEEKSSDSSSDSDSSDSSSIEDVDFEAEEDIFGTSFLVQIPPKLSNNSSDDQYVIFERSGCDSKSSHEKTETINNKNNSGEDKWSRIPRQNMFIQMELCEKNTLRDAIDGGLRNEAHRKRRLFREIVEGLVHIHEQGMIHRDLKPGNIFLDVNDHVKIGDFGLAKDIFFIKDEKPVSSSVVNQLNATQELDHFRLTGKIGTPFYVAPELAVSSDVNSTKIYYTQKVDIYSLGVIFFEMSYPFQTLMERTKVVMNLRKKEIELPIDANQHLTQIEIDILKSLLQHDYSLRPTSLELLASDYLPAPEMEEKEEQNVIRRAVQNTRTKLHKYMLNMLFQKETSEIEDYVFDVNDQHFGPSFGTKNDLFSLSTKQRVFQYVYNVLESVMQSHCAVYLSLPTLLPKHSTQTYQVNDVFYVSDNTGAIVSLSHNLRVPFARYIARNNILHFRRYSIEKVYRQRRVMGYHPKELWECALDIITPKASTDVSTHIIPDSEVLSVLCHVVNQFPALSASKLVLRVNHINLIKAILDYCDISDEMHNKVILLLGECFSPKVTQNSEQESLKKLLSNIKTHMRKKGVKQQNALQMAKHAIKELDLILNFAEKLSNLNKFSVRISPAFVISGSSCVLYSGIIFQLEREVKHKKLPQRSVIAVGGRYDRLIASFDTLSKNSDKHFAAKGGVGLSIEFEKIMKCVLEEEMKTKSTFGSVIDVVICSLTNEKSESILKELGSVTKEFWNSGIKAFCFPEDLPKNIDELHAFCKENSVRYAVVIKETFDSNQTNFHQMSAKLFAYEKERFIDKKGGPVSDIVEYVTRSLLSLKSDSNSASNSANSDQTMIPRSDSNKVINNQSMYSNDGNYTQTSAIASNIKVTFICERLQPIVKKRHEKDIISQLSTALNFVMNNTIIEVLAVDVPFRVIKAICAEIELNVDNENEPKSAFEKSVQSITDKHLRHRKHIQHITDALYEYKIHEKIIDYISDYCGLLKGSTVQLAANVKPSVALFKLKRETYKPNLDCEVTVRAPPNYGLIAYVKRIKLRKFYAYEDSLEVISDNNNTSYKWLGNNEEMHPKMRT